MKGVSERTLKLYEDNRLRMQRFDKLRVDAASKKLHEDESIRKVSHGRRADPQIFARLYEDAAVLQEKRKKVVDKEILSAGGSTNSKRNLNEETFTRLYEGGRQRSEKIREAKLVLDQEEEKQLKDSSIHKNVVAGKDVFDRLHAVKKKVTPDTTPTSSRPWLSSTIIESPIHGYGYGSSTPVHKRRDVLDTPRGRGQLSNGSSGLTTPTRPGMRPSSSPLPSPGNAFDNALGSNLTPLSMGTVPVVNWLRIIIPV